MPIFCSCLIVMAASVRESLPIRLTKFYLFLVGMGIPESKKKQRIMFLLFCQSVLSLHIAAVVVFMDIYYVWGDFYEASYSFISIVEYVIVTLKFVVFSLQHKAFIQLMIDGRRQLWHGNYCEYGKTVIKKCEKQSLVFVALFAVSSQFSASTYAMEPLLENLTRNATNRMLPFSLWFEGIPFLITPYYEITFIAEMVTMYFTAFCYFSFDNFLALVNIFITGHFEILAHRLETLYDANEKHEYHDEYNSEHRALEMRKYMNGLREEFIRCVKQHQMLIEFTEKVESVFSFVNLLQTFLYSLLVCFIGYQLILPGINPPRRIKFVASFINCLLQLFTFAHTCNNVTVAGIAVGEGVYFSKWNSKNSVDSGRALTRDLMVVLMRTQRPCCLTAWGFFPVTLDTFKSMLSTAFSYLTLMRKSNIN